MLKWASFAFEAIFSRLHFHHTTTIWYGRCIKTNEYIVFKQMSCKKEKTIFIREFEALVFLVSWQLFLWFSWLVKWRKCRTFWNQLIMTEKLYPWRWQNYWMTAPARYIDILFSISIIFSIFHEYFVGSLRKMSNCVRTWNIGFR